MKLDPALLELTAILDAQTGRYDLLKHVRNYGEYLNAPGDRADEEVLTEPVLAQILERVLGFPTDQYVPQLGKSGLKPDFTPRDLIAHPFVLDAKSSDQRLKPHLPQIRAYVEQRSLDFGLLFNLRELAVYRRGQNDLDPELSFSLLPLWHLARGEAMAAPEYDRFLAFHEAFRYRSMGLAAKIAHVRTREPWVARLAAEPNLRVDVEFLVEQLRSLSRELADEAGAQIEELERFLNLNPGRAEQLQDELLLLALELAPGADLDALPDRPLGWRLEEGLPSRVWRQYLLRVAYLALTRVMLYRSWEDVDFVKSYLFDGGFDNAYEELDDSVREVLREAFLHGAERYRWLFGADNNYDWYRPRENALVDVLYLLAPVPLGKLDADVLGGLYVSYVDEIDRDRLGQFFTPRPVVRFMLDRVGFAGPDVFRIEGDMRKPRRVFDFATGSGGFLVEAARRVIDDGGADPTSVADLTDALTSIVTGFVGGEISPFPYYLTEVNLLLQVSRLLGRLKLAHQSAQRFVLGTLHVDSLTAKSDPAQSLENLEAGLRADQAELATRGFGLVPLDGAKRETFSRLREDGGFDLVVGNPPYVAEANNKPLFDHLRAIPAWKGIYRGKTDYLYYFLWLAVEKLAPGGRLCVITPAGWMNAGAADFLRRKLSDELRLDELYLFGAYKLFGADQGPAPTPTVESAILVATKARATAGHKLRVVALEDDSQWPDRDALLAEMATRRRGRAGRRKGIHVHDVAQASLRPEYPWAVKFGAGDVATRVVAELQSGLDAGAFVPLERDWKVFQGIQTGADAYTRRIDKRLNAAQRTELAARGLALGKPILELPPGSETREPWASHPEVLVRSPEPRAILYAAFDDEDFAWLVVPRSEPDRDVLAALEPWKPILATRAEISRNARRQWWEAAWPRSLAEMSAPKVVALYRTDRGRFALDEDGSWQPSIKTTIAVGRDPAAPVAYLCGLLNSELLDLWYAVRGKTPWHVRRNYEPKRMNEMPYRRPDGDPRADTIAELVRVLAANRRQLLPHRVVARGLEQTIKDPWRDGPVDIDDEGLVGELEPTETVSVRLDPTLEVTGVLSGRRKRIGPGVLEFRSGRREVGRLAGPPERLDFVEGAIGPGNARDAASLVLPKDATVYGTRRSARAVEIGDLLAQGRALVEEVERLVCALYDLPDELTEAVIDHAVRRAGRSAPAD